MERLPAPERDDIELAAVLQALADPIRLKLLVGLADGEPHSCAADTWDGIDVHKSTLSHHYKVLREAGISHTIRDGRNRYVELRRKDLDARFPGLLDSVINALD